MKKLLSIMLDKSNIISRTFTFTMIAVMLLSGFAALITVIPNSPVGTASAEIDPTKDTYVWDGEGDDALASNATNWYVLYASNTTIQNDVAPAPDSNLVWNGTSTDDCTFDIDDGTAVFYSFTIATGYTGKVTQAATADIGIGAGGYAQAAGTFTGAVAKIITNAGSWTKTGGTLTDAKTRLVMTTDGTTITSNAGLLFHSLTANGNIALVGAIIYTVAGGVGTGELNVASGKSITVPTGGTLRFDYSCPTYTNVGSITGAGTLDIKLHAADRTLNLGNVSTAAVTVGCYSSASGSRALILGTCAITSNVTVASNHASYIITLNMNGKTITGNVAVSTRGGLTGAGIITGNQTFGADSSFTQTGDVTGTGDLSIHSNAVFTGNTDYWYILGGNFTKGDGETCLADSVLRLKTTGTGKTIDYGDYSTNLYDYWNTGSVKLIGDVGINIRHDLNNGAGAIFNNSIEKNFTWTGEYGGGTYSNLGSIIGIGNHRIVLDDGDDYHWANQGVITTPLTFRNLGAAASAKCIIDNWGMANPAAIYVTSDNTPYLMTVELGCNIVCGWVYIQERGALDAKDHNIKISGSWDSSAGTWTPETSNVHFTGTRAIKTAAGQTFYNLTVGAGAGVTQSSNIEVTNWMDLQGGSWDKNGYDLIAPMYSPTYSPITSMNEGEHYEFYPEFNSIVNMTVLSNNATWLIPDHDDIGMTGDTLACDSGTYVINLEFTNVIGTYWINWTITVNNTLFGYFISMPITDITAGQLYSYHPEVSCNGTYTLWLGGDNVLYASNITGNITGYPNAGVYSIILWMEDESGNIAYQNWTLTVNPVTIIWTNDDIMNFIAHWAILLITLMMALLGYKWHIGFLTVFGFIFYLFAIPYVLTGESLDIVAILGVGLAQIGIIIAWLKN